MALLHGLRPWYCIMHPYKVETCFWGSVQEIPKPQSGGSRAQQPTLTTSGMSAKKDKCHNLPQSMAFEQTYSSTVGALPFRSSLTGPLSPLVLK